jgi:hypothetical protein
MSECIASRPCCFTLAKEPRYGLDGRMDVTQSHLEVGFPRFKLWTLMSYCVSLSVFNSPLTSFRSSDGENLVPECSLFPDSHQFLFSFHCSSSVTSSLPSKSFHSIHKHVSSIRRRLHTSHVTTGAFCWRFSAVLLNLILTSRSIVTFYFSILLHCILSTYSFASSA